MFFIIRSNHLPQYLQGQTIDNDTKIVCPHGNKKAKIEGLGSLFLLNALL